MSRWRITSPWPQWRSHWHVLHAWPGLAQALVLSLGSLTLAGGGSFHCSGELWQAWWDYPQTLEDLRSDTDALRQRLRQHQALVQSLQSLPHPSGLALPAWQAWAADTSQGNAAAVSLAGMHGLQSQSGNERMQWRGTLPQLLAAWQQLPHALPWRRIQAFELQSWADPALGDSKRSPPQLQLDITWGSPAPHGLGDISAIRQQADPPNGSHASPMRTPVQVWHNPFAPHGLRMALPPQARQALGTHSPWDGRALSDYAWAGMLAEPGKQRAVLRSPGHVQMVSVGQAIGQHWGRVVQIAPDHLVVQEWHPQPSGEWQSKQVRIPAEVTP